MNSLPTLIIRTQSEAKIIGCMGSFSLVARGSFSSGARKQAEGEGIGGLRFFARGSLSSGVRVTTRIGIMATMPYARCNFGSIAHHNEGVEKRFLAAPDYS